MPYRKLIILLMIGALSLLLFVLIVDINARSWCTGVVSIDDLGKTVCISP